MNQMKKALYISSQIDRVYSAEDQAEIARMADVFAPVMTAEAVAEDRSVLEQVQLLLTTWSGPVLDEVFLDAAPTT